jgi:sugar phosphate isomerase/epimerase
MTVNSNSSGLSRRGFLAAASAAAAPFAFAPHMLAKPPRPLGAQLYTVRDIVGKEPERILKAIADIGYTEVEGNNRAQMIEFTPIIRKYNLRASSCHVETPVVTGDWEHYGNLKKASLEEAIESVKNAGVEYFTMAYITPAARGGPDFFRATAEKMNHAAELCHKAGLRFAYHNHAFEFGGNKGERPIDIFRERLDPKLVSLEMDVFWASVAGQDPVEMLKEWRGRVALLHLKDKPKGFPVQYSESVPHETFREVGSGSIDFRAVLNAAPAAGVKHYFVEQDQSPGDPIESLRKSFDYLQTL